MPSNVEIILKTIDKTKGGVSSAVDNFNKLKSGALAAAATLTAAALAVGKMVKQFTDYSDQVENVSRLTGQTAEESSRLVQVADDLFVSYEALTAAMRTAARQGISTNMEGIISLAEEYQGLSAGVERSEFLLEKFGRQGLEMAKVLEQPISKLRQMSASVPENLILSSDDIAKARELKVATDNLSDAWQGFINESVLAIGPALTKALGSLQSFVDLLGQGMQGWQDYAAQTDYAALVMEEMQKQTGMTWAQLQRLPPAMRAAAEAQANLNISLENGTSNAQMLASVLPADKFEEFRQRTLGASEALDDLVDRSGDLNFILSFQTRTEDFEADKERILSEMTDLRDRILELQAQISAGNGDENDIEQLDEMKAQMSGLTSELNQSEAAFKKWQKQAAFSLLQAKLAADGLSDVEFDALLKAGEDMGLLDPEVVEQAKTMLEAVSDVDASSLEDAVSSVKYLVGQDGKRITIYVEQITTESTTTGQGSTTDKTATDKSATTTTSGIPTVNLTFTAPGTYLDVLSFLRG